MDAQRPDFACDPDTNISSMPAHTTPRDRAIYVPSITPTFAMDVFDMSSSSPRKTYRAFPPGVLARDLNFLDPANEFFRLSHVLWSAGQAMNQKRPCIVNQRDRSATVVIGDSGGYQIANSGLVISTDQERLKILRWLEANTDYAMTLDVPATKAGEPGFHYKTFKACLDATIEHLNFFEANRRNYNVRFLNVLQGNNKAQTDQWYNAVKSYEFEGWAFAGKTRKNFYLLCRRIVQMYEEGLIKNKSWIHVLGTAELSVALLLTVLQRAINQHMNVDLRISYDTSTPFSQIAHSQAYSLPNFTNQKLVVSSAKIPDSDKFIKSDLRWPWPSPLGDKLTMGDVCISNGVTAGTFRDSQSNHYAVHHSLSVLCNSIDVAHRIFDVERVTGAATFPRELFNAADAIDEVIGKRSQVNVEHRKTALARGTGAVNTDDERF